MKYQASVEVSLRPGYSDPEGETTVKALQELSYPVEKVETGKVYQITLRADSPEEAESQVDAICRKLLANPVKDNYNFRIEEVK